MLYAVIMPNNTMHIPREMVCAALSGQSPSRLLIGELDIAPDIIRQMVGLAEDAPLPLEAEKAVLQRWQHDLVTVPFSHGWGAPTQPDEADALFRLSYWQAESVFALIDGPFSAALKAWPWQDALLHVNEGDAEYEAFMADAVMDIDQQLQKIAAAGADGVIFGEDIAIRRGPLVNPRALKKSYFPFLSLLVMSAHDLGLFVVFHSDGNLWPLWQDIIETGIDGVQCLDPYSAMSLVQARQRSTPYLCLWGNLDLGWLAQPRSATAMQARLHDMLHGLEGTPIIFGSSSGLFPGVDPRQLDALYAAARAFPWSVPAAQAGS